MVELGNYAINKKPTDNIVSMKQGNQGYLVIGKHFSVYWIHVFLLKRPIYNYASKLSHIFKHVH